MSSRASEEISTSRNQNTKANQNARFQYFSVHFYSNNFNFLNSTMQINFTGLYFDFISSVVSFASIIISPEEF